jgi:putative Mg2+ transporter-C (MgtC) family protein
MDIILEELTAGLPDAELFTRVTLRLVIALLLGAIIGSQRERAGKPAGLRTHMLVCMGSALFVLIPAEFGIDSDALSRVLQGLAAGIGFIGGGAILKLTEEHQVKGLTTAAGIWLTAAVGAAAGLGRLGLAILSIALAWITLALLGEIEFRIESWRKTRGKGVKE